MNQLKAGAALNYIIIGLNTLTGLLYTPYMLRCLGQNEYGLYSLVASIITYLTLLDFGFGSAIVRYATRARTMGAKEDEWRLYGMFVSGYTLISILVSAAGMLLYFNVDRMFDRTMSVEDLQQARIMMIFLVANLAFTFPLSVFGSIVTSYERFIFQRTLNILRIILTTVTLVVVLAIGYKAVALVIVQTAFSLSTLIINFVYCKWKLKIHVWFNHFNFPLLKEIMIFSWWNFLCTIADRAYWSTGQFILGIYSGTIAVALYSVSITLLHLFISLSTSFSSVLLPKVTVLASQKGNEKKISDLFIKTGRLQFYVLSFILTGFILFGKPFILLWAGKNYSTSYLITLMFFISILIPLIQNVGLTILQARAQMKFRSLLLLVITVINLIAQITLSKIWGAVGCGVATALCLIVGQSFIMNFYYNKYQKIDIKHFWGEIVKMSIAPVVIIIAGLLTSSLYNVHTWIQFITAILIFIVLYFLITWRFSMNSYERNEVKTLVNLIKR